MKRGELQGSCNSQFNFQTELQLGLQIRKLYSRRESFADVSRFNPVASDTLVLDGAAPETRTDVVTPATVREMG